MKGNTGKGICRDQDMLKRKIKCNNNKNKLFSELSSDHSFCEICCKMFSGLL